MLDRVIRLYDFYKQGLIPTLASHEVNPGHTKGSKENYLYFTLPVCINFQRSSPAMWASALKTYEDLNTRYLFDPHEVSKRGFEEIQSGLIKHKLALQKNKHTQIWITISKTLAENFDGDPRKVLIEGENDVVKILHILQKQKKNLFPYLSGPKMANYWLYILSHYTDCELKNMSELSIIPDTHVIQSTIKLGITYKEETPEVVAKLWKDLLKDSPITPVQMHPVLWNWSRNNFLPEV